MKTRYKILIACMLVFSSSTLVVLYSFNFNPVFHLMFSEEYRLETAMKSDIVQTFLKSYPDSKHRYVTSPEQEPTIVFEKEKEGKLAFLAVGNFDEDKLAYMYTCFTSDYRSSFFHSSEVTANIIKENLCF